MPEMYINKLTLGSEVRFDLTGDTVAPGVLASGYTAHDRSGAPITGTSTLDVDSSAATAQTGDVLAGKTFAARGAVSNGTMTDNGAVSGSVSALSAPYTVPAGYHNGSGSVAVASAEAAKIIPGNIKNGVQILGVTGTYKGDVYTQLPYPANITGLFEPDSLDIANNVWSNKISGGNNITLTGGAVQNGALQLTNGNYGAYTTSLLHAYYCVARACDLPADWRALVSKGVNRSSGVTGEGFDLYSSSGKKYWFSSIGNDIASNLTSEDSDYHLFTILNSAPNIDTTSSRLRENVSMLYIDCNLIGVTEQTASYISWDYDGSFYLNAHRRGSDITTYNDTEVLYKMFACQVNVASFTEVEENSRYFLQKYLG